MTHVNRVMQHTSRGSLFTVKKPCEEIFGLFYRHAKVVASGNAIILAVSGLLHLSEANISTGMPAVFQRHKLATLKYTEKGRDANINVSHTKLATPSCKET